MVPRTPYVVATVAALALTLSPAATVSAAAGASAPPDTTTPSPDDSYDTGRAECIGLLPKPDCGRPPAQAGDRGGWIQFLVFGIIVAAIAGIFTYVFRAVLRGDRRRAAAARDEEWVDEERAGEERAGEERR